MTTAPMLQQAVTAFQAGDDARAIALAQAALQQQPDLEPALAVLANAGLRAQEFETAITALRRLCTLRPKHPAYPRVLSQACNRHAAALRRQGGNDAAETQYRSALSAWPDNGDAAFNLALLLQDQGRDGEALPLWRLAARLNPDDAETRLELAGCLARLRERDEARLLLGGNSTRQLAPGLLLRAAQVHAAADLPTQCADLLTRAPLDASHHGRVLELAEYLARAGEVEAARAAFRRCHEVLDDGRRSPGLRSVIAEQLVLPAVHADVAAIDRARTRFEHGLQTLESELDEHRIARCERSLAQLGWANFYLAYHGRNDRVLQTRHGDLLARWAPRLAPIDLPTPAGSGTGRRIGLVSSSFRQCTAGHYFASWPRMLAEAGYEVVLFQLGPMRDAFTDEIAAAAERLVFVEDGVDGLLRNLLDARCDLLIYPELGMDYRLPALAALRLAPRQAAAWGHPATAGLPTLDAWFSCAEMEPEDAREHYREPLRLLPGLGTDYPQPASPPPATRAELGLPDGPRLYLLPHALYKLHPDNDAVLVAIATSDPDAVLVLFEGAGSGLLEALRSRIEPALRAAGVDPQRCLRFLPMTSRERFLQINRVCDVMVDALHWSGGNTSLDALASGLPVITCPGRYMRARQSAAMLRLLGLDELIVPEPADLARSAVALANDRPRRDAIAACIHARLPALFDATGVAQALTAHVQDLLT